MTGGGYLEPSIVHPSCLPRTVRGVCAPVPEQVQPRPRFRSVRWIIRNSVIDHADGLPPLTDADERSSSSSGYELNGSPLPMLYAASQNMTS